MDNYIDDVLKWLGGFVWIIGAIVGIMVGVQLESVGHTLLIWLSAIIVGAILYGMGVLLLRCLQIVNRLDGESTDNDGTNEEIEESEEESEDGEEYWKGEVEQ